MYIQEIGEMSKIIFKTKSILNNIEDFLYKSKKLKNLKLLLPVKACSNKDLLKLFFSKGFGFDVSNQTEIEIVKDFNCFLSIVGPNIKSVKIKGLNNFIIYYDSLEDYMASKLNYENKGIRINFNNNKNFKQSHFGVSVKELINSSTVNNLKNVHFHIADVKDKRVLNNILKELKTLISFCKHLKNLDIGGGYENLTNQQIVDFMFKISEHLRNDQNIILECGDLWFKNSGILNTKVIGIRTSSKSCKKVFLDVCKDSNLKWSAPKYMAKTDSKLKYKYVFYGSSCYENDLIGIAYSSDRIQCGDALEFGNISHYSVEWNTYFNGNNPIEVRYE